MMNFPRSITCAIVGIAAMALPLLAQVPPPASPPATRPLLLVSVKASPSPLWPDVTIAGEKVLWEHFPEKLAADMAATPDAGVLICEEKQTEYRFLGLALAACDMASVHEVDIQLGEDLPVHFSAPIPARPTTAPADERLIYDASSSTPLMLDRADGKTVASLLGQKTDDLGKGLADLLAQAAPKLPANGTLVISPASAIPCQEVLAVYRAAQAANIKNIGFGAAH